MVQSENTQTPSNQIWQDFLGWVYRLTENFFDNRASEFFNICYNNEDSSCVSLNKRTHFMDML